MDYLIGEIMGTENNPPNTLLKITVLVVDDDNTSLAIVSAMLRQWQYEVTSVKNPIDALALIRARPTGIDIVVTDLHMPEMSGIELQRQINREFQLPVIIMSSDDQESVMLESLQAGAVFFIVKPVNPDQLKNLWQYAISGKKGKSVMIEEIRNFREGESLTSAGKRSKGVEVIPVSSTDSNIDHKVATRGTKRKFPPTKNNNDDEDEEAGSAQKKAKIIWTSTLHNQFLNALRHIGMDKAVPKKILEFMGVPGLTRENVASHLQKYRMFLRRLAERNNLAMKALAESILRSSFANSHPELLRAAQEYARMTDVQRNRALAYQPPRGFGRTASTGSPYNTASTLASTLFSNQNASANNRGSSLHFRYGQSRLLAPHQADNYRRLLSTNTTTPLYHDNRHGYGNYTSNLSLNGSLSYGMSRSRNGLTNGANYMEKYQRKNQERPSFNYDVGSSSSSFRYPSLANGNMGMDTFYPSLNSNWTNNYNNSNSRLPSYGQLPGMGQNQLTTNGGYGMNPSFNWNMNLASMGNQTFGHKDQGGSSNPALSQASVGEANDLVFTGPDNKNGRAISNNSVNLMSNAPSSNNINVASPQRSQQLGSGYLDDVFLQRYNNNNTPAQEQDGGESVQNLEFLDNILFPEVYPSLEDLLKVDFSEALSLEVRDDEQAVDKESQVPTGGDVQMMETGGNGSAPSNESCPTDDANNQVINQQQSGGSGLKDFDLESALQNYNSFATNDGVAEDDNNQFNWDDDFLLDSLLNFNPDQLD